MHVCLTGFPFSEATQTQSHSRYRTGSGLLDAGSTNARRNQSLSRTDESNRAKGLPPGLPLLLRPQLNQPRSTIRLSLDATRHDYGRFGTFPIQLPPGLTLARESDDPDHPHSQTLALTGDGLAGWLAGG